MSRSAVVSAASLRTIAEWNPVSTVTHAARDLFGNMPGAAPPSSAWSRQHAELDTLAWIALLIAVFAPLAIRRYPTAHIARGTPPASQPGSTGC